MAIIFESYFNDVKSHATLLLEVKLNLFVSLGETEMEYYGVGDDDDIN